MLNSLIFLNGGKVPALATVAIIGFEWRGVVSKMHHHVSCRLLGGVSFFIGEGKSSSDSLLCNMKNAI